MNGNPRTCSNCRVLMKQEVGYSICLSCGMMLDDEKPKETTLNLECTEWIDRETATTIRLTEKGPVVRRGGFADGTVKYLNADGQWGSMHYFSDFAVAVKALEAELKQERKAS